MQMTARLTLADLPAQGLERRLLHRVTDERAVLEEDEGVRGGERQGRLLGALLNRDELLGVG